MSVCTKERKGVTAEVLRATPCTNSLGGESGGQKHEGCGGRSACWKFAAVSSLSLQVQFMRGPEKAREFYDYDGFGCLLYTSPSPRD